MNTLEWGVSGVGWARSAWSVGEVGALGNGLNCFEAAEYFKIFNNFKSYSPVRSRPCTLWNASDDRESSLVDTLLCRRIGKPIVDSKNKIFAWECCGFDRIMWTNLLMIYAYLARQQACPYEHGTLKVGLKTRIEKFTRPIYLNSPLSAVGEIIKIDNKAVTNSIAATLCWLLSCGSFMAS